MTDFLATQELLDRMRAAQAADTRPRFVDWELPGGRKVRIRRYQPEVRAVIQPELAAVGIIAPVDCDQIDDTRRLAMLRAVQRGISSAEKPYGLLWAGDSGLADLSKTSDEDLATIAKAVIAFQEW